MTNRQAPTGAYPVEITWGPSADTRTCGDPGTVSVEELFHSTQSHCEDVRAVVDMLRHMLNEQAYRHDDDKFLGFEGFFKEFRTGFATTTWWDRHRQINRHHLGAKDGVPEDVNLLDVIEYLVDCVVAGKTRSVLHPVRIDPDVLMRAFQNTVALVDQNTVVKK